MKVCFSINLLSYLFMDKVYIVMSGEYSDITVEAVFDNMALAKEYVSHHGIDYYIDELDVNVPFNKGKKLWYVVIRFDNHNVTECCVRYYTPKDFKDACHISEFYDHCSLRSVKSLVMYLEADTMERAMKVANERLNMVIAGENGFYRKAFDYVTTEYGMNEYPHFNYHTGEIVNI